MEGERNDSHFFFAWRIGVLIFLIGVCGVLTIYSSQSQSASPLLLTAKQSLFLIAGLAVMAVTANLPFRWLLKKSVWIGIAGYFFLFMVLFWGIKINGMRGWYSLHFVYIQPSDVAKGIYLLLLVHVLCQVKSEVWRFLASLGLTCAWTLPILLQPDYGTVFVYWGIFGAAYFLAGGRIAYLAWPPVLMAMAAGVFLWRNAYAWQRITGFLNPDADPFGSAWHIRQFQLAIARGGLWGEKIGHALWSNTYLPFSYNDSAFATLSETLGFVGAIMLYGAFAVLIYFLFRRSLEIPATLRPERLYLSLAGFAVAFQTLLHVSVNTTLLPPTGITMPLISYGGSSLVGSCLLLGLALSADRFASEQITSDGVKEIVGDGKG